MTAPGISPEEFNRWNGLLRWATGDEDNRFALTFMGYTGSWTSTDQIPVDGSGVGRFGTLDPSSGGTSQRYSLNAELVTRDGDVVTRANVYGIHYALDLFSNFTYFTQWPWAAISLSSRRVAGSSAARWRAPGRSASCSG
jgi:hypothetical protein